MGPWGHPESEQSRQIQVHPGAVSLYDPLEECLFKLVPSTSQNSGAHMLCVIST